MEYGTKTTLVRWAAGAQVTLRSTQKSSEGAPFKRPAFGRLSGGFRMYHDEHPGDHPTLRTQSGVTRHRLPLKTRRVAQTTTYPKRKIHKSGGGWPIQPPPQTEIFTDRVPHSSGPLLAA